MGNANIKSYTTKITSSNTDTQIFTSPWRAQRRFIANKIVIANEQAATAAIVKFYDKDLANGTPPVRGDNGTFPLLEFIVPATATAYIDERMCPREFFISGCVGYSSVNNVVVTFEIKED